MEMREQFQKFAKTGLSEFVAAFEKAFPGRVYGYFVEGSLADGSAIPTSDIDLVLLFKDRFADESEPTRAQQTVDELSIRLSLPLDVGIHCMQEIEGGAPPTLKLGSRLLYGQPLPSSIPLISLTSWTRDRMHAAYWLMTSVFQRPAVVSYPRAFPDPTAEFFGYTERTVVLDDGSVVQSTRDLIRVMGWGATALSAYLGETIVARKRESHEAYLESVGDEWAPFLESLYLRCRMDWHYLLPPTTEERRELQSLCHQALEFENHFLKIYRTYLLHELTGDDADARDHALSVQTQFPFDDVDVRIRLTELMRRGTNGERRDAGRAILLMDDETKIR